MKEKDGRSISSITDDQVACSWELYNNKFELKLNLSLFQERKIITYNPTPTKHPVSYIGTGEGKVLTARAASSSNPQKYHAMKVIGSHDTSTYDGTSFLSLSIIIKHWVGRHVISSTYPSWPTLSFSANTTHHWRTYHALSSSDLTRAAPPSMFFCSLVFLVKSYFLFQRIFLLTQSEFI